MRDSGHPTEQESEGPTYVIGLDCGHETWFSSMPHAGIKRCSKCGEWRGVIVLLVPGNADPAGAINRA